MNVIKTMPYKFVAADPRPTTSCHMSIMWSDSQLRLRTAARLLDHQIHIVFCMACCVVIISPDTKSDYKGLRNSVKIVTV